MCTSLSSLTTPSEASRHYTCTRRESATTAYFGCMELLLPPRPFWAVPSSPGSSLLFYVAMRAMVHVRRARQGPAPNPVPYTLDKRVYTSSFSWGVGACWWMPSGGEALLCYSLCRGFRFLGSGRVPRCLRFLHDILAQPADAGWR